MEKSWALSLSLTLVCLLWMTLVFAVSLSPRAMQKYIVSIGFCKLCEEFTSWVKKRRWICAILSNDDTSIRCFAKQQQQQPFWSSKRYKLGDLVRLFLFSFIVNKLASYVTISVKVVKQLPSETYTCIEISNFVLSLQKFKTNSWVMQHTHTHTHEHIRNHLLQLTKESTWLSWSFLGKQICT